MIRVRLPGDDLILANSLLDEVRYPANDLLEAYRLPRGLSYGESRNGKITGNFALGHTPFRPII